MSIQNCLVNSLIFISGISLGVSSMFIINMFGAEMYKVEIYTVIMSTLAATSTVISICMCCKLDENNTVVHPHTNIL